MDSFFIKQTQKELDFQSLIEFGDLLNFSYLIRMDSSIMNILIAPNAFKHSLTATAVAEAIQAGFLKAEWPGRCQCLPIGDGGTGTGDLLIEALNATILKTPVENLLGLVEMKPWGWCENQQLAIIDLATTSGIDQIKPSERNPLVFTTYGTGQLIKAALDKGAKEILLCVGGSATIDGGMGIAKALGVHFNDFKGMEIEEPQYLQHLSEIDLSQAHKQLSHCNVKILCDVQTPLLGNTNAIEVYGKQKGANDEMQIILTKAMQRYNQVLQKMGFRSLIDDPKSGAAGGVAGGLERLLNAELVDGFEAFYEYLNIEEVLKKHQILITGEGKLDNQTLEGKGPFAIAQKARNFNIINIAIAGMVEEGFDISESPFNEVHALVKNEVTSVDFSKTAEQLTALAYSLAIDLKDRIWKHSVH